MPFNYSNKTAGDLIRSQDWNAAMAAIATLFDKFNLDATIGHSHTGGPEDGPQIGTAGLQNAAVTLQKLADLCVSAAKIQDNAVINSKIANGAVTNTKMAANSVSTANLVDLSVSNSKLANGAVTSTKIGSNAVSASHIVANSITGSELASNAVSTSHIANLAVTAAKIANGVIPDIGIATSYVGDGATAPVPTGFIMSECRFYWAYRRVAVNLSNTGSHYTYASINSSTGEVTISNTSAMDASYIMVLTLAKKGGW